MSLFCVSALVALQPVPALAASKAKARPAQLSSSALVNAPLIETPQVSRETLAEHAPTRDVSLETLLQAAARSAEIAAAEGKVTETKLRAKSVKAKRVLIFFKTFNAPYIEGSAESDIEAAEARLRQTLQDELAQAAGLYLNWVQSLLEAELADAQLMAARANLGQRQGEYVLGDLSQPEVIDQQLKTLQAQQALVKAMLQSQKQVQAVRMLLQQLPDAAVPDLKAVTLVPEGLTLTRDAQGVLSAASWQVPAWMNTLLPDVSGEDTRLATPEQAGVWALKQRADMQDYGQRLVSAQNLKKAAEKAFNPTQAKIFSAMLTQAQAKYVQAQQSTRLNALQAWQTWQAALNALPAASQAVQLADLLEEQAQSGRASGSFSALMGQQLSAQARASQLQAVLAQVALQQARLDLAYKLGIVTVK
ncbi:MAG: TolC family protein [Vampirovibrionales bacterium]|nr:TolC family protein [Vampirovibrionales bacterium]